MGLLRLLLAISVLTGHADKSIFGFRGLYGNIAVQCFFMISGFYMALVLNEKYTQPKNYFIFIQQRFLRIYPTYYAVLAFFLIIEGTISCWWPCGTLVTLIEHGGVLDSLQRGLLVLVNLIMFGQDYTPFFNIDPATGATSFLTTDPNLVPAWKFLLDPPVWSVGIELTFYLVAPFLVRRAISVQALVFLVVFAARIWASMAVPHSTTWLYFFAPLQLSFFMAGSIGYHYYRKYKQSLDAFTRSRSWIVWVFCSVIVLYNRLPLAHHLYPYFMVLAFVMIPVLFSTTRKNTTDRAIGELSYPFYLIHYHIIMLMNPFYTKQFVNVYGPVCAGVTLGLAYLCYRYVEIYTERYREGLYERKNKSAVLENMTPSSVPAALN